MKNYAKRIVLAGMIGALYATLTILQNLLLPGSASQAIQFRVSEALMMLALFSPTAVYGLTAGCAIANIFGGMPIDIAVGSIATLLAGLLIYRTRNITLKGFPILSLLFPALCNGIIVGAELTFYSGQFKWGAFLTAGACVALGEIVVSAVIGIPFYYLMKKFNISKKII